MGGAKTTLFTREVCLNYDKFSLGSNRNHITIDIEPSFISELKGQLKDSADDKDESSLPHPSRVYYNYNKNE